MIDRFINNLIRWILNTIVISGLWSSTLVRLRYIYRGEVVERVAMPFWRLTIAAWVGFCVALIVSTAGVFAQDSGKVVRADFSASHIDVVPFLGAVQSTNKQIVIKLPANSAGQSESMNLQATGAGPQYRWAIFTTANPSAIERELVIDAARQSFPGSGIASPSYSSSRISAASSSRSVTLRRLSIPDRDLVNSAAGR